MIRYTATHSSGATKTRTSRGHLAPRYSHALWVRWTGEPAPNYVNRSGQWEVAGMGKLSTIAGYFNRLQAAGGYELEIVELQASS
ncbi:MAG: hypothetical protein B7Y80_01575 [Hyphomicrobium sp. 32-62-53]|nr:MAG: hypothetical protein B7Z29_01925 [Hyphomicrobium sp. 12-62-95]OYY01444.1 MAG: hypothetical protein B7Y80_01575 [Hyphomicrobium sp. 32-62-53]